VPVIRATIFVEHDRRRASSSQGRRRLKRIGTAAREDLERFLRHQGLPPAPPVAVRKGWRKDDRASKSSGSFSPPSMAVHRRRPWSSTSLLGESDRLVDFYTAITQGAGLAKSDGRPRSRFGSALELFTLGELVFSTRGQ